MCLVLQSNVIAVLSALLELLTTCPHSDRIHVTFVFEHASLLYDACFYQYCKNAKSFHHFAYAHMYMDMYVITYCYILKF
jgi:hypothetical protein